MYNAKYNHINDYPRCSRCGSRNPDKVCDYEKMEVTEKPPMIIKILTFGLVHDEKSTEYIDIKCK